LLLFVLNVSKGLVFGGLGVRPQLKKKGLRRQVTTMPGKPFYF
jgi:hypothetical protein